MVESTRVMSQYGVTFSVPVVVTVFGMQGLELVTHMALGKKGVWVYLFLLFGVCYPINFFANCVVSAMYLRMNDHGTAPTLAQVRDVASIPSLFRSVLRLLVRTVAWVIPLVVIVLLLLVVAVVAVVLIHGVRHAAGPGRGGVLSKGVRHGLLLSSLVIYSGILSRYTFVMPMVARARLGSKEVFDRSARIAKDSWATLWISATCLSALVLTIYESVKAILFRISAGPLLSDSFHVVELLVVAVLSAWYWIFATILMLQSTEEPVQP